MTLPQPVPVQLSAGMAQGILDLLATTEALLSVLKARGEGGEGQLQASLEDVTAHLTDGHDAGYLIDQIKLTQRELELLLPAGPTARLPAVSGAVTVVSCLGGAQAASGNGRRVWRRRATGGPRPY